MPESTMCDRAEMQEELRFISTHLSALTSPSRFVLRYGAAVKAYLRAILPTQDDAEEVEQDFLLRILEKGIPVGDRSNGRYRHYLIAIVKNAALRYLSNRSRRPQGLTELALLSLQSKAERQWHQEWRSCVLQRTWQALKDHEAANPGNLFHTVLLNVVQNSIASSEELAEQISMASGQSLTAEAFRKQLSRARRMFAQLLITEVARTIRDVTPEHISDELQELDLLRYVQSIRQDFTKR